MSNLIYPVTSIKRIGSSTKQHGRFIRHIYYYWRMLITDAARRNGTRMRIDEKRGWQYSHRVVCVSLQLSFFFA